MHYLWKCKWDVKCTMSWCYIIWIINSKRCVEGLFICVNIIAMVVWKFSRGNVFFCFKEGCNLIDETWCPLTFPCLKKLCVVKVFVQSLNLYNDVSWRISINYICNVHCNKFNVDKRFMIHNHQMCWSPFL
jgi:hypothetical protein